MDIPHRRILREGQEVDLSSIEFALLQYRTDYPDTLLLYQDLYQNVWAIDSLGVFRTVMVHISNLRKKIDPDRRASLKPSGAQATSFPTFDIRFVRRRYGFLRFEPAG